MRVMKISFDEKLFPILIQKELHQRKTKTRKIEKIVNLLEENRILDNI